MRAMRFMFLGADSRETKMCDCALLFQQLDNSTEGDKDKVIQEYQKRLRQAVNPRNLKLYVNSFLKYVFNT